MPNMVVPASSQRMFNTVDVVLANYAMGRLDNPFAGFEQTIYPNTYVLSSPQPSRAGAGGGYAGPRVPPVVVPEEVPKSSVGARSLWPQLR